MCEMEEESFIGKASPDKELEAMRRKFWFDAQPFGSGQAGREEEEQAWWQQQWRWRVSKDHEDELSRSLPRQQWLSESTWMLI